MIDHRDREAITAPTDRKAPIEKAEPKLPMDPTENAEPTEPIEQNDPLLAMLSIDPSDQSDHLELVLDRIAPSFRTEPR